MRTKVFLEDAELEMLSYNQEHLEATPLTWNHPRPNFWGLRLCPLALIFDRSISKFDSHIYEECTWIFFFGYCSEFEPALDWVAPQGSGNLNLICAYFLRHVISDTLIATYVTFAPELTCNNCQTAEAVHLLDMLNLKKGNIIKYRPPKLNNPQQKF